MLHLHVERKRGCEKFWGLIEHQVHQGFTVFIGEESTTLRIELIAFGYNIQADEFPQYMKRELEYGFFFFIAYT